MILPANENERYGNSCTWAWQVLSNRLRGERRTEVQNSARRIGRAPKVTLVEDSRSTLLGGNNLGIEKCFVRGEAGRNTRYHWPQRSRKEHASQNPFSYHRTHGRMGRTLWPSRISSRGWDGIPSRVDRQRKRLLKRHNPGNAAS